MTKRRELRPGEVAAQLAGYRVIDVREASEFEGPLGHIARAEHVPQGDLPERIESLSGGLPLLLVCRSGNRSGRACERFPDAEATNLAGGMIEWNELSLPVERRPLTDPASVLDALAVWLSQVQRMEPGAARAFVSERMPAPTDRRSAVDALAAIDRVAEALSSGAAPPADLQLVCASLRGDLEAMPRPGPSP